MALFDNFRLQRGLFSCQSGNAANQSGRGVKPPTVMHSFEQICLDVFTEDQIYLLAPHAAGVTRHKMHIFLSTKFGDFLLASGYFWNSVHPCLSSLTYTKLESYRKNHENHAWKKLL